MQNVDIIIPTHNRAKLLKEALGSVQRQTYKHYRVILVDDASTDATKKVAAAFRRRLPIAYIRLKTNRGPAAARNMGLRSSSSPLVAFLDSDDLWLPRKLELQVKALRRNPGVVLSHTDFDLIGSDGRIIKTACIENKVGKLWQFHYAGMDVFPRTSTVVMRRKAIEKIGLFDENFRFRHEDTILWIRTGNQWGKRALQLIPRVLTRYRRGHHQMQTFSRSLQAKRPGFRRACRNDPKLSRMEKEFMMDWLVFARRFRSSFHTSLRARSKAKGHEK